jgi:hypothetical protein
MSQLNQLSDLADEINKRLSRRRLL